MGGLFGGGSKSTKTPPSTIIQENPTPRGTGVPGDDKMLMQHIRASDAYQQEQKKKADSTLLGQTSEGAKTPSYG